MSHHLFNNILKPILVVAVAGLMAHMGCNPAKAPIGPLDVPYTEATIHCSSAAKTLQEATECRAKVNWKYGLCPDSTGKLPC